MFACQKRRPSSTILLSRDVWGPAPMSIVCSAMLNACPKNKIKGNDRI
jgi:hypothetical protein